MAVKIAVIGECMVELAQRSTGMTRGFGGDTLNTAVYLSRVDPALTVHYVTALGTDSMSRDMLTQWQKEGIHTDLVQRRADKLPGLYLIETDGSGERTFHYWRSDAAARYWLQGDAALQVCQQLPQFDYLYLSGISLAILDEADRHKLFALLAECRAGGTRILFDNNYRPRLWQSQHAAQAAYGAMLALTDIAFLTQDDEDALWGLASPEAVLARTRQAGVEEIVIKRGAEPCLILKGNQQYSVAAMPLAKDAVRDTTAAGDSFSAGYLAMRLAGQSAVAAAHYAHQLAGTVIQYPGAIIPAAVMPVAPLSSALSSEVHHANIA